MTTGALKRIYSVGGSIALTLSAILISAGSSKASQINWRSPNATTSITSDGSTPMDSSFEFQLGSFADGFIPSIDNTLEWANSWRPLDTTTYNGTTRFFSSSVLLTSNDPPFTVGTSGYIWGRNRLQGNDDEWILMRSVRWRWPVSNTGVTFPVDWDVDEATIAIVGEMHGADFLMKSAKVESGSEIAADRWLTSHFSQQQLEDPDISGWNADPDLDGCRNLLEFTTGGDPLRVDPEVSTSSWDRSSTSPGYTMRLPVTLDARDLVSVKLQFSSSLKAWLPLPAQGSYDDSGISFSVAPGSASLYYRIIVTFQ